MLCSNSLQEDLCKYFVPKNDRYKLEFSGYSEHKILISVLELENGNLLNRIMFQLPSEESLLVAHESLLLKLGNAKRFNLIDLENRYFICEELIDLNFTQKDFYSLICNMSGENREQFTFEQYNETTYCLK